MEVDTNAKAELPVAGGRRFPQRRLRCCCAGLRPPPGFVDVPHPTLRAPELLVSHKEEITVGQSLAVVLDAAARTDLKDAIHKSGSLPGVSGEHPLNDIPFAMPGSRRLVCLSDGSALEEQVLEQERNQTSSRFRYIVWNYSTRQARPIEYGIGEFRHTEMPGGRTHIVWTYSFKLKDHEFPGYLGALGRYLLRIGFLDRQCGHDAWDATVGQSKLGTAALWSGEVKPAPISYQDSPVLSEGSNFGQSIRRIRRKLVRSTMLLSRLQCAQS